MIKSSQNPVIKRLIALQSRRVREKEKAFLIEGERELKYAISSGIALELVICCPHVMAGNKFFPTIATVESLINSGKDGIIRIEEVSARIFSKIAYREKVGGMLGIGKIPERSIEELEIKKSAFLVVAEGIEKPGNLGALLRTADCAGVDAFLVCDEGLDLYNPNVVRSSLGALFAVKTYQLSSEQAVEWFRRQEIQVVVSSPGGSVEYHEIDATRSVAIVLGSEKAGLSGKWLECGGIRVRIPMYGKMDSLNVSCSGAILMYEVARQRRGTKGEEEY